MGRHIPRPAGDHRATASICGCSSERPASSSCCSRRRVGGEGIHEFQEANWLPTFSEHVWDLGVLDPDTSSLGRFLMSLFGWRPDPSLLMVIDYFAYLIPVGLRFWPMTSAPKPVTVAQVP